MRPVSSSASRPKHLAGGVRSAQTLGGNEVMTLSRFIELAAGPATGAALAAILAWVVGQRISARWSVWQKRRESSLVAVSEFGRLYGEFFSIWKLWNYSLHDDVETPKDVQWHLLERAASAEAAVESLLVRLTCQTSMTSREVETAGKFRQAYQQLRQVIRDGDKLDWSRHDHPEYVAFKRLAVAFALLLATMDQKGQPSEHQASRALLDITSNRWESNWSEPVEGM